MTIDTTVTEIEQCFQEVVPEKDNRAKIQPLQFVSSLVFCFLKDKDCRSLAGMRRAIMGATGERISRGTFWERIATLRLHRFLLRILAKLMEISLKNSGVFRTLLKGLGVKGIYLLDSSSCSLPEGAKGDFPAPRNNTAPSAIKVHFLLDLFGGVMKWFELSPATMHDRKGFPPVEMLRGMLIIFDLGYWDYFLMKDLIEAGVFFLSRVKTNATIQIVEVISGLNKDRYEGKFLLHCRLPERKHRIVELVGEIQSKGEAVLRARVIGFWNPMEHAYHWYVTNLAVPAALIYPLYRLRWQLELQFKACKGTLHLDEISTANTRIIESLVLVTLIACMVAGILTDVALRELPESVRLAKSFQRSAMLLLHIGTKLIDSICKTSRDASRHLLDTIQIFVAELVDPNFRSRPTSLQRVWNLSTQVVE